MLRQSGRGVAAHCCLGKAGFSVGLDSVAAVAGSQGGSPSTPHCERPHAPCEISTPALPRRHWHALGGIGRPRVQHAVQVPASRQQASSKPTAVDGEAGEPVRQELGLSPPADLLRDLTSGDAGGCGRWAGRGGSETERERERAGAQCGTKALSRDTVGRMDASRERSLKKML